jgi:hypothetical protein
MSFFHNDIIFVMIIQSTKMQIFNKNWLLYPFHNRWDTNYWQIPLFSRRAARRFLRHGVVSGVRVRVAGKIHWSTRGPRLSQPLLRGMAARLRPRTLPRDPRQPRSLAKRRPSHVTRARSPLFDLLPLLRAPAASLSCHPTMSMFSHHPAALWVLRTKTGFDWLDSILFDKGCFGK